MDIRDRGIIITFYSFKGGVGRTMALANIAVLLAQRMLRVLIVDFDLEAPGLDRYFESLGLHSDYEQAGLIDLLVAFRDGESGVDWRHYISEVHINGSCRLSIMTSGRQDEGYGRRVLDFQWASFFSDHGGGAFCERLREEWASEFDVVLIDSRTGLTDSGGICTVQLPDVLVPVFTTNRQSVDGARDVVRRAQQARQELAYDRLQLVVFPLPSRFDGRQEFEASRSWLAEFGEKMGPFYADWLPRKYRANQILERTKIPYVAYFSFGEPLPVLTHGTSDPESIGFAYNIAATLIADRFGSVERVLEGIPAAPPQPEVLAPSASSLNRKEDDYAYDIYVSYRRERVLEPWIEELVQRLAHWVGEELGREAMTYTYPRGAVGDRWPDGLVEAVRRSRILVPLISPLYFGSTWCVSELATFLDREKQTAETLVFPIALKRAEYISDMSLELTRRQSLDAEPFVSTVRSFWETEDAIHLERELRQLARTAARAIRSAPRFDAASKFIRTSGRAGN